MIIKRGVRLQLVAFLIITIIGIAYTSVRIVGVGKGIFNLTYTAYADLADSGGAFTNAEVTYRGVAVGRVGPLTLTRDGVRAQLNLNRDKKIPLKGTQAYVLNRSGVGEQYIDLRPQSTSGPYLADLPEKDRVIQRADTHLPVSIAELLTNFDKLLTSVDTKNLGTIIDELDKGLAGEGPDLQKLLDNNKTLLDAATETYPELTRSLQNGKTVLDTQVATGSNFREFSRNLASLTDQVRKDDPTLRHLLDITPEGINQGDDLLNRLKPDLPVQLANASIIGQVLTARIPAGRQLLLTYPILVGQSFTVAPGDGTAHFGLVLNHNSPPVCKQGYEGTKVRYPQNTKEVASNRNASCKAPANSPAAVRGARNAPKPGPTPVLPPGATSGAGIPADRAPSSAAQSGTNAGSSTAGGSGTTAAAGQQASDDANVLAMQEALMTGYDPKTRVYTGPDGKSYKLASNSGQQLTGDASWQWMLLGPLAA